MGECNLTGRGGGAKKVQAYKIPYSANNTYYPICELSPSKKYLVFVLAQDKTSNRIAARGAEISNGMITILHGSGYYIGLKMAGNQLQVNIWGQSQDADGITACCYVAEAA